MCFILATYELKRAHIKTLESKWTGNHDGAGLTWHVKRGARADKGYFTWKELEEKLVRHLGQTVVVHLRNATHGVVKTENSHPFLTCNETAFMCHNGILPAPWSSNWEVSDSATMARMLEPMSIEQIEKDRNQIERTIGYNKLVFLTNKGRIVIINDDLGEWGENKRTWVSQQTSRSMMGNWGGVWASTKAKGYKVLVNGKEAKRVEIKEAHFDEGPNSPNMHAQQAAIDEYINNLPK